MVTATAELQRATLTLEEVATLVGLARSTVYDIANRDGAICGVPVISLGRRKVLPRSTFLAALGVNTEREAA